MNFDTVTSFIFDLPNYCKIEELSYSEIGKLFLLNYIFLNKQRNKVQIYFYKCFRFIFKNKFIKYSLKIFINENDFSCEETELNKIYICISKDYLGFCKEPCVEYQAILNKANMDLHEIDNLIENYNKSISENETKKNTGIIKPDVANYGKILFETYINRNNEYKNEINYFIDYRITSYTIKNCLKFFQYSLSLFHTPYNYSVLPNFLTSNEDLRLLIKFPDIPIHEYKKIKEDFKKDENSIYPVAENYINSHNIKQSILDSLDENHILNKRKDLIIKIMSYYDVDNLVFCHLATAQIEGLLSDYCLEFGHSEKELFGNAIGYKSEQLYNLGLLSRPAFDYYSKIFPIDRNRMMHGMNIISNYDNLAKMVLLDFNYIIDLSKEKHFDFNIIKSVLKKVSEKKSFKNNFNFCLILDFSLNSFYNFEPLIQSEILNIDWALFLNELDKQCKNFEYYNYSFHAVLNLKRKNIETDKCIKFFKKHTDCKEIQREKIYNYLLNNC